MSAIFTLAGSVAPAHPLALAHPQVLVRPEAMLLVWDLELWCH